MHVNEFKVYGRPIAYDDDDTVFLLLGDSQAECRACKPGERPEEMLEKILAEYFSSPRVFTLAVGGYGFDQQILLLRRYFARHRADYVLHWQSFSNDGWNNAFPTSGGGLNHPPKPTFRLVDDRLVEPDGDIGEQLYASRLIETLALAAAARGYDLNWFWLRFRLPEWNPPVVDSPNPAWPILQLNEQQHLHNGASDYALMLDHDSPREEYQKRLWQKLLLELKNLTEHNGARFATFQEDRRFQFHQYDRFYFKDSTGRLYEARGNLYYETQMDWNAGMPFYLIPVEHPDPFVSAQDLHLNPAANEKMLSRLAAQLKVRGFF